jgi:hypothetical protein
MMEAVRTSETSVDNNFTRQYNPEDNSEHCLVTSLGGGGVLLMSFPNLDVSPSCLKFFFWLMTVPYFDIKFVLY